MSAPHPVLSRRFVRVVWAGLFVVWGVAACLPAAPPQCAEDCLLAPMLLNRENAEQPAANSSAVSVSPQSGLSISESGLTANYSIGLANAPTATVIVTITPDAQVSANGSTIATNLAFTAGDCPGTGTWCTPQVVTVAAVNDLVAEGTHTGTLSHSATSTALSFKGIAIASVTANITDNDVAKLTFVTAATHDGGFDQDAALAGGTFGATNGDTNGTAEADNFCDSDANHPAPASGTYRALLVDNANRIASITANAGDGQVNWILQPNRSYVRADGATLILTTDANRIFSFGALTNSIGTGANNYWTGLNADWTTSTRHCSNWQVNSGGANQGERGVENATDGTSVGGASGNRQCNQVYRLLCVQQ